MNSLSENKMMCKATQLCKRLSDIRVKKECDFTLSIYDNSNPYKSETSHHLKSLSDQSLLKLLMIVALVSITMSAVGCICSFFKN